VASAGRRRRDRARHFGVELAGALAELAKAALARDFRHIDPATARIILIEGGPRLLPSFPPTLSERAARALVRLGVEVRLGSMVTSCDRDGVAIGNARIDSRTVIRAAGVTASPAAAWLGVDPGRGGRVPVGPDLTLPGHPEIFVIGDTAQVEGTNGPLPGVAPVAKQQGAYAARVIAARVAGKPPSGLFRYRFSVGGADVMSSRDGQEPMVRRLSAGGNWIRKFGSARR
jgi:NADH:ubiquinone reductase (H+-translocating)